MSKKIVALWVFARNTHYHATVHTNKTDFSRDIFLVPFLKIITMSSMAGDRKVRFCIIYVYTCKEQIFSYNTTASLRETNTNNILDHPLPG